MVLPAFDGNKLYGSAISYNTAPSAVTGYAGWLSEDDSNYQTNNPSTGPFHAQDVAGSSPWWANVGAAGTQRIVTFQLPEARGGNWFIVKGVSDGANYHVPQALQLEYSDNGADWTTVDSFSALTTGQVEYWGVWFDISAAGSHVYWRFTAEQSGDGLLIGHAAMVDVRTVNDRAEVSSNRAFTQDAGQMVWLTSGDSDYTTVNPANFFHRGTQVGTSSAFRWTALTAGQETTYVMDCQAAEAAGRIRISGTADITYARPTRIVVAYSDDGVDWTDHYDSGVLSGTATGQWFFDADLGGETHRYWRVTFTNGGTNMWVYDVQIYGAGQPFSWAYARPWTWGTAPASTPSQDGFLIDADSDADWPGVASNVKVTRSRSDPGGAHAWGSGQLDGYVDLGEAREVDYMAFQPHSFNGSESTPTQIEFQYSDNAVDWTSIKAWTGLTSASTNGWVLVAADTSALGAHRYWRVITDRTSGFHGYGSVELYASAGGEAAGGGGGGSGATAAWHLWHRRQQLFLEEQRRKREMMGRFLAGR